jgi:hypothetical protein
MANLSIKTGTISRSMLVGNPFYVPPSFESIATVTAGAGGAATITFSSISGTYKHLQIRAICTDAANNSVKINFNSDTSTNYAFHFLQGNGATASAGGGANNSFGVIGAASQGFPSSATIFGAIICDILDYANTNKFKTIRTLNGYDANGSGTVEFTSSLWRSTSAITTIVLDMNNNFSENSSFALYGIKG